jgi:hypothetical protein
MLPLVALAIVGQSYRNFDLVSFELSPPPPAPVVKGSTKTWQLASPAVEYTFRISPAASGGTRGPQMLAALERRILLDQAVSAKIMRKSEGRLESSALYLLNGTALIKDKDGNIHSRFLAAFIVSADEKIYEFIHVSRDEQTHNEMLKKLSAIQLNRSNNVAVLQGVPAVPAGYYQLSYIEGDSAIAAHTVLFTTRVPRLQVEAPPNPLFERRFTALIGDRQGALWTYATALLKEGDSRSDYEVFRGVVAEYLPPAEKMTAENFTVVGGSGKSEPAYRQDGMSMAAALRFERSGNWISVLTGSAPANHPAGLAGVILRRTR